MAEMGLNDAGAFDKRLFDETRMLTAPTRKAAPPPGGGVSDQRPPPVASLVGTVVLDRGTLATDGVVEREILITKGGESSATETVIFEFKPPVAGKPVREQAQANHVVWSDELPDKSLELRFTGADDHARTVVLRPVDGEVAIKVFDLELETILGIGEGHDLPDEDGDPDFAIFYAISTGWPFDVEQVPVPHPMKPDQVVVGGRRQTCKPGLFLGWR